MRVEPSAISILQNNKLYPAVEFTCFFTIVGGHGPRAPETLTFYSAGTNSFGNQIRFYFINALLREYHIFLGISTVVGMYIQFNFNFGVAFQKIHHHIQFRVRFFQQIGSAHIK